MGAQFRTQHQDPGPAPGQSPQGSQQPAEQPQTDGKIGAPGKGKSAPARQLRGKSAAERSAAADRLLSRTPATTEEKPGEKPADDGKAEEKPAEKPAEQKPDTKPAGAPQLPAETRTALGQLLASGNLGDLAEQLGIDRKTVDVSSGKLAISRKRLQDATQAERAAKEIRDECRRAYRDPHLARKAVDEGKFHEAAEYIAHVIGMDFGEFTRHVAAATKGMSKEELERFKKERDLEARERALAEKEKRTETEKTEQERIGKACKTIEAKLPEHPAIKLKNGARLIYAVLDDHFKDGKLTIGYKQAADRVLQEFEENARALGYTKGGKAAEPEKKPEVKPAPEEKPAGKKEFPAEPGQRQDGSEKPRRGRSFEERSALASRTFERSRLT